MRAEQTDNQHHNGNIKQVILLANDKNINHVQSHQAQTGVLADSQPQNIQQQISTQPDYNNVPEHSLRISLQNQEILLQLRKKSFKLKVIKNKLSLNYPKSNCRNSNIVIVFSDSFFPSSLRQIFGKFQNLYGYLYHNINDKNKIKVTSDSITILSHQVINNKQLDEDFNFDINQMRNEFIQYSSIGIVLSNVEDYYLQYSPEQLKFISQMQQFINGDDHAQLKASKYSPILQQFKTELEDGDEEGVFEVWQQENKDPFDQRLMQEQIDNSTKSIQQFDQKYSDFFQKIPSWSANININNIKPSFSKPVEPYRKDSVFPPQYNSPYKPLVPGAPLSTNQQMKMQAITSKREKLKMAKQWLKEGLSATQVINRLQSYDRISKSQKSNIVPSKMIEPNNNQITNLNPLQSQNGYINQSSVSQSGGSNQRQVREMLITLLKQKRYKKLDQIQSHMANAGLQTSVAVLKRMIDQIRAKSAQRKQQLSKK